MADTDMPVTYQLDKTKGAIHTKCFGFVTLEEVLDHFQALQKDPDCPPCLNVLVDLCEITSDPASDDLRTVSDEIGRMLATIRLNACAVVVSSDHLFGMSRMFTVFARDHFRATHVFRTFHNAEKWLDSFALPVSTG
jgi:hypothetical protein